MQQSTGFEIADFFSDRFDGHGFEILMKKMRNDGMGELKLVVPLERGVIRLKEN